MTADGPNGIGRSAGITPDWLMVEREMTPSCSTLGVRLLAYTHYIDHKADAILEHGYRG
jgi:hypothetical protein